jgi:hypothetical protein
MPWLACVFVELNRLTDYEWHWHIVEGAAMNRHDTRWIASQAPRLSGDGTGQFLDSIGHHPRVTVYRRPSWDGKREMVNAPLAAISQPGVLLQVDSDELWTADQLRRIIDLFHGDESLGGMRFWCRYFVGPNVVTTSENGYGNFGNKLEWTRAWRFRPGMTFSSHEPPVLAGNQGDFLSRDETRNYGLVFDHYAWALKSQAELKRTLYGKGYETAPHGWDQLQHNRAWPVRSLKHFMPWVGDAGADSLFGR